MLSIIISTIIGGLLIPFVLMAIKSIFKIGNFSLRAIFIPIRELVAITLRWGKYLAIPLGLLMMMHPAEFSVANGKLSEKFGMIILVIGLVYTIRACFRGFTQIAAVGAWCIVCLIGIHFYGQQKVIDKVINSSLSKARQQKSVSGILQITAPFADPKKIIHHSSSCANDCLEEISFIDAKPSGREGNGSNYSLDSSGLGVVEKFDSMYRSTLDQSQKFLFGPSRSTIETLPNEAFFGKPPQEQISGTASILDQGKELMKWLF